MSEIKLDFKEQMLLILYFSPQNKSNKTRLMKLLFLLEEFFNLSEEKRLNFVPHNFGPWAKNFETLITPILLLNMFSSRVDRGKQVYSYSDSKKEKICAFITKTYLQNSKYENELKLVEFLSKKYKDAQLNDLIQLVYFLSPEYTNKSEIKSRITEMSTKYNVEVLLEFIEKIPLEYVLRLFKDELNYKRILRFFNVPNINIQGIDYQFLIEFIQQNNSYFSEKEKLKKDKILSILYEYPSERIFKHLKLSFISVFSIAEREYDEKSYRYLLLFLLKCLTLDWPLNSDQYDKFNDYLLLLKDKLHLDSFFDSLPSLKEEERILTEKSLANMTTLSPTLKKILSDNNRDIYPSVKERTTESSEIIALDFSEEEDEKEDKVLDELVKIPDLD